MIKFHKTQEKALSFLIDSINNRKKVVGLTGAGGTGKSEILSYLVNSNEIKNVEIYTSASTHKAASRLKNDLPDTTTLHSAVARPNYKMLYINLEKYYKSDKEPDFKVLDITKKFLELYKIKLEDFKSHMDLIVSLGKTVFDEEFFKGYTVKDKIYNSCLIIDEASMVPTKSIWKNGSLVTIGVDAASMVYDTIVLVGDMYQLPPIDGKSSFDNIEVAELTKNYRSNKGLLRCIDYVRNGGNIHNYKPEKEESVQIVEGITKEWYERTNGRTDVVHLAYRNKTRHSVVQSIRGSNKNPKNGEPVLYRGFSNGRINKGDIGIFNDNIISFGEKNELKWKKYQVFDEYNEKGWSIFSYGYCMTAHSAQGSGFDHVIIHSYDIPHFIDEMTKRQWLYTAVSRAKKSLTIIL